MQLKAIFHGPDRPVSSLGAATAAAMAVLRIVRNGIAVRAQGVGTLSGWDRRLAIRQVRGRP